MHFGTTLSKFKAFLQAADSLRELPSPQPKLSSEDLGDDYYNVTTASITEVRDELAALAGLTDVADQL